MGISPTHFNYYLSKQPIKGIYLVVKLGGIDVTADYEKKVRDQVSKTE